MILRFLPVFLVLGTVGFIIYMGFHNPVIVNITEVPGKVAVYVQYRGEYSESCDVFERLHELRQSLNVTDASEFGFYYDNPYNISDPSQARAIFGFIADPKYRKEFVEFALGYPEFNYTEFRHQNRALSVTYPYRNRLSLLWVVFHIYPIMAEYGEKHDFFATEGSTVGALEIYKEDTIQIAFPSGETAKDFLLSVFESPRQFTAETPANPPVAEEGKKPEL